MNMTLAPNLVPLAPLIGTWRGTGRGHYPTISDFAYTDEWQFLDVGKPFLAFVQRTWHPDTHQPMHTEAGYLRVPTEGVLEIVAALPTGQTELGTGTLQTADGVLTLSTDAAVACTPSAKRVDRIARVFTVDGDQLLYRMSMAAVGIEGTPHLESVLARIA